MYNSKTALYHVPRPFPTARYLPTAVPHCLLPPTYTTLWIRLLKDGDGFLSTRWYPKVYIKNIKKKYLHIIFWQSPLVKGSVGQIFFTDSLLISVYAM